jgi:hypothetical protein
MNSSARAIPRREVLAVLAGAGLHEQRVTLLRALHVERAVDPEVLTGVLDPPHPLGQGVHAAFLVGDHGVVRPAVPEFGRHLDELGGPAVAVAVQRGFVEAEVAGRVGAGRGDDVPAGPATRDVVQRGEPPGQVVRLVVARRRGGDQADVLGC